MSTFKRLLVSVKSQIDSAADQFENHEALAGAAIKDLQQVGARSSIQLRHVQQTCASLQDKLLQVQEEADRWEKRAIVSSQGDKQKALACIKRLKATRLEKEQVANQLQQFQGTEARIKRDLEHIQYKLSELKKKKQLLQARQNRTDALSVIEQHRGLAAEDVDSVFERWEDNVIGEEYHYQDVQDTDVLASGFEQQEEDVELQFMLDELLQKPSAATANKGENNA